VKLQSELKAGATIAEALRLMGAALRRAGVEQPEVDARLLIGHALQLDRARLLSQSARELNPRDVEAIAAMMARRLKREPVARIIGCKEFWSLPFSVTPDVLVPRPETETLVEAALDALTRSSRRDEKLRILDIGTGSGALLLALLRELPNASGVGTDISAAALQVARDNAARNGLAARCTFAACDIAAAVQGPFDLVVSNPPYVSRGDIATLAPEVRDYDPALALDGGRDGLDAYRALAAVTPGLLARGGMLIVELGAGQESAVRSLFTDASLRAGSARHDLAAIPRALVVTRAS
jgi:release factor glutamine methyltransferase